MMIDVVVVTYNSSASIRNCIEPLVGNAAIRLFVVDNASEDGCLRTIDDLPVERIFLGQNYGFATACNVGWRLGTAPYVLFLNPDARIDEESLILLSRHLDRHFDTAAVGPKIFGDNGELQFSQRRFPAILSSYAEALFIHHVFPRSSWANEMVFDRQAYDEPHAVDWLSGACILVRRSALEQLHGWDERFFMYSEDTDLCRRLRCAGHEVFFVPASTATHIGGLSAPRDALRDELAWSRVLYFREHFAPGAVVLERLAIALGSCLRIIVTRGGVSSRVGHARAVWRVTTGRRSTRHLNVTTRPARVS
jgi:N-acetylglucosaminyl-diphospho-decaprenol L-rhamnosyltransferase